MSAQVGYLKGLIEQRDAQIERLRAELEIARQSDTDYRAHIENAKLRAALELSHDDLCRLSRSFNENANLANTQDCRINEWLKGLIARNALAEEGK